MKKKPTTESVVRRKRYAWMILAYILFLLGYAWGLASASVNDYTLEEYHVLMNARNISPKNMRKVERMTKPMISYIQAFDLRKCTLEEVKYVANKYCGIIIGAEQIKGHSVVYVEWQSPFIKIEDQANETHQRPHLNNGNTQEVE